jgi:transposase-like protein
MGNATSEISESGNSKPSPKELWRYVCPNCEKQVYRSHGGFRYRCNDCEEMFEKDDLKDLKGEPFS